MCAFAGVSRSGYYAYLKRKNILTEKDVEEQLAYLMILKAFHYGSWKKGAKQIKFRIERDYGVVMNLKKIRRIMKKYGLVCPIRKVNPVKAMIKAQQSNKIHSNLVNRLFKQGKGKKIILTDITYIKFGNGRKAYLSVMKDSCTKMILSWQISLTLDVQFVLDTVNKLVDFYGKELDLNVVIHSDQGCHYTSAAFQKLLKDNNIQQSMSRRGNCWDNSPQESFFAILKTEMDLAKYRTYESVALGIAQYITYYNTERPQVGINKMTPLEYDDYLSNSIYLRKQLPMVVET